MLIKNRRADIFDIQTLYWTVEKDVEVTVLSDGLILLAEKTTANAKKVKNGTFFVNLDCREAERKVNVFYNFLSDSGEKIGFSLHTLEKGECRNISVPPKSRIMVWVSEDVEEEIDG